MTTADWPRGTVAFLFTDVEGSTGLWERHPDAMPAAYARHDAILRAAVERHGGVVYKVIGDAVQVAFPDPSSAVAAAVDAQRALTAEAWPLPRPLRVRMALHVCEAAPSPDGDYRTPGLNRLGRLLAAGHGGQVLCSVAVAAAVRDVLPDEAALLDLGERRLKDLPGAEPVFQLAAPGLPTEFPPLRTLDARPHDLPQPPSPLIGREAEVAAIRDAIRDGGARLVTLTGPGGIGKTRLALATAAGLIDAFADGVRWLPLAGLVESHLVVPVVAARLGVKEEPGRPLAETLAAWLRERAVLLVLDNCEQVADAVADGVAGWLEAAPGVTVLATSRGRLRLRAERAIAVDPLPLPPARASALDEVRSFPAGRLVLDRAEAMADARPTDADAPALARICALLDGVPLAIELAAARLDRFAPADLVTRLERRLPELADGPRDLPARQRTLRDTIAWSYDLLDPAQQATFRLLSAFAGGCALDATEQVSQRATEAGLAQPVTVAPAPLAASPPRLLDAVTTLADQSLVRLQAGDGPAGGRVAMLETIREFGLDQLTATGEEAAVRQAHAAYFLELAESARDELRGSEAAVWLDRLEAEHANFRAALGWWLGPAEAPAQALRLASALTAFWRVRGHLAEGLDWLERSLAAAGTVPSKERAQALHHAANLAADRGDFALARTRFHESLALRRELDDQQGVADTLDCLGVIAGDQGDFAQARAHHAECLPVRRRLGDPWRLAVTLGNLGSAALNLGAFAEAVELLEEAQALLTPLGDRQRLAWVLNNLGIAARRQGDLDTAATYYEQALALNRELGYTQGIGGLLNNLGMIAHARNDLVAAEARYEEALALWRTLGDTPGAARTLSNLAGVAEESGDPARALSLYAESLRLRRSYDDRPGIVDCLTGIAGIAAGRSPAAAATAAALIGAAEALRERTGVPVSPGDRPAYERRTAAVRAALDEGAYVEAETSGRALRLDEAIDQALRLAE